MQDRDLKSITCLLGQVAICSGELDDKRRPLIAGLAEMADADGWLWIMGRVDPIRKCPIQTNMLFGGLSDHQVSALLDSPCDPTAPSPCDERLAALVAIGKPFVHTRQQLVDDETWYSNASAQTYYLGHGIDQCMFALTPFEDSGFSGIGFFRFIDRPAFTEQQRQIVQFVGSEVP